MTIDHHPPDGLSGLEALMRPDVGSAERRGGGRERRNGRRTGLIIAAVVMLIVFGAPTGYVAWALSAPVSAPVVTSQVPEVPTPAAAVIPLPPEGAAAISIGGADDYLGAAANGIWAASGGNEPRSIASVTKLITALVILDAKPLADADDPGPTITYDEADHDLYDEYYVLGATVAAMPAGSSQSQFNALATMLIPSASNYAEAVSTWAFGSQGAFLSATRTWLADHGLAGTTIVEPTGISARNTSTPSDLLTIGKLAAANPTIARIVAIPSLSLPNVGIMRNTNNVLGEGGITGLKTGNLGEGTHNLLYTAFFDVGAATPLSVTGVSLGGYSRASVGSEVLAVLDGIRQGFHTVPLITAGQGVGTLATPWGSTARMVAADSASIFTWSDTPIAVTMQTTTPVTYEDGEVVGSITWTAGPHTETTAVEIEGTIDPPTEWWRLTHPGELGAP